MSKSITRLKPLLALIGLSTLTVSGCAETHHGHSHGSAEFIAHAAVMVESGPTKILFDPIFDKDYGSFQLVAPETQSLMMAGQPPFDGVDAVFVSHAHGDHFAAGLVIEYLTANPEVQLIAPMQALTQMQKHEAWDEALRARIDAQEVELNASLEQSFNFDGTPVAVTRLRLPHAGGARQAKIENIVFRVSLNRDATVMHMGDTDPAEEGLTAQSHVFNKTETQLAFVPLWFVGTENDAAVHELLNAEHLVGVHVPKTVPEALAESGADYFSVPGETREIAKDEGGK